MFAGSSHGGWRVVKGDLVKIANTTSYFDVIVHGANCQNVMNGGIARAIKSAFPAAFIADRHAHDAGLVETGAFSHASVTNTVGHAVTIVNAYTQFTCMPSTTSAMRLMRLHAIRRAFRQIAAKWHGKQIGIPKIGAGLAGGRWADIEEVIRHELRHEDVTLVLFE